MFVIQVNMILFSNSDSFCDIIQIVPLNEKEISITLSTIILLVIQSHLKILMGSIEL